MFFCEVEATTECNPLIRDEIEAIEDKEAIKISLMDVLCVMEFPLDVP